MFEVELFFHGDLDGFLHRELRGQSPVRRVLKEKTSSKDVIEACGVPHTEVDVILAGRYDEGELRSVGFSFQLESPARVEVHSVNETMAMNTNGSTLQVRHCDRFVADGHLGKLARNLRLLGLDTSYERDADDRRLLEIMAAENRALLTRDRRLLMHSAVRIGYCPRSSNADLQTGEVLRRFALLEHPSNLKPYSRCLRCNSPLTKTKKSEVLLQLAGEPLTLKHYDEFRRCTGCGGIFWPGTHVDKLSARMTRWIG